MRQGVNFRTMSNHPNVLNAPSMFKNNWEITKLCCILTRFLLTSMASFWSLYSFARFFIFLFFCNIPYSHPAN